MLCMGMHRPRPLNNGRALENLAEATTPGDCIKRLYAFQRGGQFESILLFTDIAFTVRSSNMNKRKPNVIKTQLEILNQLFSQYPLMVHINEECFRVGDFDTPASSPISITIHSADFLRDAGAFGEIELADAFVRGYIEFPDENLPQVLTQIVPLIQKAPSSNERLRLITLTREYRSLVSPLKRLDFKRSIKFAGRDIRKGSMRTAIAIAQRLSQRNLPVWVRYITEKINIKSHYDLPDEMFHLFLSSGGDANEETAYSCSYPQDPHKIGVTKNIDKNIRLEQAQESKFELTARKLGLHRVDKSAPIRLLDIGCGVGGFLCYCLTHYGDQIEMATGITLSQRQLDTARKRGEKLGFSEKLDLRLQNYRDINDTFDRIATAGMVEHVGFANMPGFTRKVHDILSPNGRALLHLIVSQREQTNEPGGWVAGGSEFIRERIFPGGQVPGLSYMQQWLQQSGMTIEHEHLFGYYYYWTLTQWYKNFCRNNDNIEKVLLAAGYSAAKTTKIIAEYKLYLAGCAVVFQQGYLGLAQFTLNKDGRVRDDASLEAFISTHNAP